MPCGVEVGEVRQVLGVPLGVGNCQELVAIQPWFGVVIFPPVQMGGDVQGLIFLGIVWRTLIHGCEVRVLSAALG